MKNKGYTAVELIIVIAIMGLITLLTITKVSYAFTDNTKEAYNVEIEYLLNMAKNYGNEIKDEIGDSKYGITITVEKLIEKGYVNPNQDGKIVDPRNKNVYLNDLRIKITLNGNQIETEVVD